jgi:hypothetical protein
MPLTVRPYLASAFEEDAAISVAAVEARPFYLTVGG